MQKNLFTKYFTICAGMILASITVLGALLMGFASQYFRSDKLKVLEPLCEPGHSFDTDGLSKE